MRRALEAEVAVPIQHVRTIFTSDLRIGTAGFQAHTLLDFLKAYPSDYLYLVGDIVHGWQLRQRWFWPQSHNDVVQKLLRCARKGCWVIFVPGNHDESARAFVGHQFGGIEVREGAVHTTTHGVDAELFTYRPTCQLYEPLGTLARPVSLFVGRVPYEKNIEAFLDMVVLGSKSVCGLGPLEAKLRALPAGEVVRRAVA